MGDLGKIIVATGIEWLPKKQKIAQSGHTGSDERRQPYFCFIYLSLDDDDDDFSILNRTGINDAEHRCSTWRCKNQRQANLQKQPSTIFPTTTKIVKLTEASLCLREV